MAVGAAEAAEAAEAAGAGADPANAAGDKISLFIPLFIIMVMMVNEMIVFCATRCSFCYD